MKEIKIDKSKCIGCLKCKKICYSVFEVDSDGKAKVRYGVSQGDVEDAKSAEICCPTGAIKIVESSGQNKNESLFSIFFEN